MNYQQTLDFLFGQFASFQRVGPSAYKASLHTSLALDALQGHPHGQYKTIHVGGTNGKGSVSHMLAAVLMAAGYRVGLFTSPHLKDFRERIRVNGRMIAPDRVVSFVARYGEALRSLRPSFFEITTAMAFEHFASERVQLAVIEVGLGGRLDSTNIITPLLSVITNIGLDHTDLLGDTLAQIAAEKAGIIKPAVPVVIGRAQPEVQGVFEQAAQRLGAPLAFADRLYRCTPGAESLSNQQVLSVLHRRTGQAVDYRIDLLGHYQPMNLITVLAAIEMLVSLGYPITPTQVRDGLAGAGRATGLQGRWQILGRSPLVVCDSGHNADGIAWVVQQIQRTPHHGLHMVIGMVADKDIEAILALLPRHARYYFAQANIPRALDAHRLLAAAAPHGLTGAAYPSVREALGAAQGQAAPNDLIFVGGSTFVVAEVV